MTPKEKAQELVTKISFKCRECDYEENAKYAALIAVDEILSIMNRQVQHFMPNFGGGGSFLTMPNQEYQYWQEVKQEIENL